MSAPTNLGLTTGKTKRGRPKQRGNGQGSKVRQLPSGKWRWEIRLRGNYHSGTEGTKTAAERELARVITEDYRNILATSDRVTVAEYAEKWLEGLTGIRENTRLDYKLDLGYALKHIGKMKLRDVRPTDVQKMLRALSVQVMKSGRARGKPMSARTQNMVRARLRSVFEQAITDQLLYRNPVQGTKRARDERDEEDMPGIALDFDQAARLQEIGEALQAAGVARLWPALFVAVSVGLRRGECMALRWQDVDFISNTLRVRQNLTETARNKAGHNRATPAACNASPISCSRAA